MPAKINATDHPVNGSPLDDRRKLGYKQEYLSTEKGSLCKHHTFQPWHRGRISVLDEALYGLKQMMHPGCHWRWKCHKLQQT